MKRNKIPTYPKVKQIRPLLLWCECRFCHKEFRRELGYEITDIKSCRGAGENPYFISYCCNNCADTIEEVKLKIKRAKDIFNKNRPGLPGSKRR